MQQQTTAIDLIELINNKYNEIRNMIESKWNASNDITITNSEWLIITFIYGKQMSISEIAKELGISRQAAHKSIKSLGAKGLIEMNYLENNNRNKFIKLTELGERCYIKNQEIKIGIEVDVLKKLGTDKMNILKELLCEDWI
ncbi:MAG: winged helix-turn-helix transcriptional regulator [Clostridiales bacterium]|nr:winged helix-turn-helix transcriptional regulator [Clostridiales bacterium]